MVVLLLPPISYRNTRPCLLQYQLLFSPFGAFANNLNCTTRGDVMASQPDPLKSDVAPPASISAQPPRVSGGHRIRQVREQQGVSLRTASRRLGIEMAEVRRQQNENEDLTLSELFAWQQILDVPIADLLVDSEVSLSRPVLERAQMIRVMKTAASILEQSEAVGVQRLARTLVDQLIGLMPELEEVGPWHSVGQRRSLDECGRIGEQVISDQFFQGSPTE